MLSLLPQNAWQNHVDFVRGQKRNQPYKPFSMCCKTQMKMVERKDMSCASSRGWKRKATINEFHNHATVWIAEIYADSLWLLFRQCTDEASNFRLSGNLAVVTGSTSGCFPLFFVLRTTHNPQHITQYLHPHRGIRHGFVSFQSNLTSK